MSRHWTQDEIRWLRANVGRVDLQSASRALGVPLVEIEMKMRELSARKDELNLQLSGLENEIAQSASLSVIRTKAQKMGLRPASLKVLKPAPVASAF